MNLYLGFQSLSQYSNNKQEFIKSYTENKCYKRGKYNKFMAFGESLHIALARFNNLNDPHNRTIEVLEQYLRESWLSFDYETGEEENQYFNKALDILRAYHKNPKDKSRKTILVEEMITKEIENNTVLFGRVDKVFINELGQLEVLDYKTTSKVSYNLNPLEDSQLSLYLILVKHKLGYYPKVISYYYLPKNIKVFCIVNQKEIAYLEKHFSDIIFNIQNDCLTIKKLS